MGERAVTTLRRVRICGRPSGGRCVVGGVAQQSVDIAGADVLALADAGVELLQHLAGGRTCAGGSGQRDDVAVRLRDDAEAVLKKRQMAVVFAQQPVQMPVVLEGHDNACLLRFELLAQPRYRWPACASQ